MKNEAIKQRHTCFHKIELKKIQFERQVESTLPYDPDRPLFTTCFICVKETISIPLDRITLQYLQHRANFHS